MSKRATRQTRGRPTKTALVWGGAPANEVRAVTKSEIQNSLMVWLTDPSSDLVKALHALFVARASDVFSPSILRSDHGKTVAKIQGHAQKLQDLLRGMPSSHNLLDAVAVRYQLDSTDVDWETTRLMRRDLSAWLAALARAEEAFQHQAPSDGYREAIRQSRDLLEEHGHQVTVSPVAGFVAFLEALEKHHPTLVFPRDTFASGRAEYVRNAFSR